MVTYYKHAVDHMTDHVPDFQPIKTGDMPHIIGPFTNWNYAPMREIIPFCQKYDPNAPDFLGTAIKVGAVRPSCATGPESLPMTPEEEAKVK